MPSLLRRFGLIAAASAILAGTPVFAETPFTPAQRDAIQAIIKDYLVKNPEVLQEAIAELEKRQAETQRVAQQAALNESRTVLTSSPYGAVVGNPAGDVTLVEFFDYNCGYCKRALTDLRGLMKADGKLKVVLRDLPVLGPDSVEASRVALAAKQQLSGDKLFEYHARLLESRGKVGGERALALAKEMGLDMGRLQKDMTGPEVKAAVAESEGLAQKLGLTGTPAYVIGDEVISGAIGLEPLKQAVVMTRKCGRATC